MNNEFIQIENFQSALEKDWLKWCNKCEAILGHSLDGDQEIDGYSLDFAADAFATGLSAEEYCKTIN